MSNSCYNVIISSRAKEILKEHISFLAKVNKSAAQRVKNEIITAMHSLEQFPQRHPFFYADFIPPNKYHKMCLKKRYIILYQIKDDTVFIDYVLDCRQDYTWLI